MRIWCGTVLQQRQQRQQRKKIQAPGGLVLSLPTATAGYIIVCLQALPLAVQLMSTLLRTLVKASCRCAAGGCVHAKTAHADDAADAVSSRSQTRPGCGERPAPATPPPQYEARRRCRAGPPAECRSASASAPRCRRRAPLCPSPPEGEEWGRSFIPQSGPAGVSLTLHCAAAVAHLILRACSSEMQAMPLADCG